MSIQIPRGGIDPVLDQMINVLKRYEADHPDSQIDLYRQNPVSVRVRIIDPTFATQDKVDRHQTVWKYLDALDEDAQSDISALILLAPEETNLSFANLDFEDPVSSKF